METPLRVIALVPARAGSKGAAGKNTRPVGGRPLVAWSIEAAQASRRVTAVAVTSDDAGVLDIARKAGVETVIERPAELATDTAAMTDVVSHALSLVEPPLSDDDVVVLLQPTSPLRTAAHVDEAVDLLLGGDARAVVGVCEAEHSPLLANTLPADLSMRGFLRPEALGVNRQELPVYYRINGAVYAARVAYLRENAGFLGDATLAYVMPQEASVDIDSELDLHIAESLLRAE
jgi:N-acylneuraminate cytidylyltransferase/CMP-N,N'-diacetyllegionaminic acid synthase